MQSGIHVHCGDTTALLVGEGVAQDKHLINTLGSFVVAVGRNADRPQAAVGVTKDGVGCIYLRSKNGKMFRFHVTDEGVMDITGTEVKDV